MQKDLGVGLHAAWIPVANTLAIAAIAPLAGYLQDLVGRRNITIFGITVVIVGAALVGSARGFAQVVAGMAISGCGAGISELSALAG